MDGENIADYTQMKREPKTINSWGVKVKSLKSIKADATRLSKDPTKEFRRAKDLDTLDRIKKIDEINSFKF
jgi:hypothetical protein